jgi:hypothetical protein
MKLKSLMTPKQWQDMKKLTVMNLAFRLLKIFENHIGQENEISRFALFRKVYRHTMSPGLEDELRWEYVKRAMHLIRQRTKCFIASRCERGVWRYFVVKDIFDAECYINTLNKNIKRMRAMQKKALQAVGEKWYKTPQAWLPERMQAQLEDKRK